MKVTDFIFASLFASTTLAAAISLGSAPLKFYVKYNGLLRPLYGYYSTLANGDNLYVLSIGQQATETAEFTLKGSRVVTPQNYRVGVYHQVLGFGPNVVGSSLIFDSNMKLNIGPIFLCPYQGILFTIRVGIRSPYPSTCFLVDLYLLPDQHDSEYPADEPQREPNELQRSEQIDTSTQQKKDSLTQQKKDPLTPEKKHSSTPEQSHAQRLVARGTKKNNESMFEPEDSEEVGELKDLEKERPFDFNDIWIF